MFINFITIEITDKCNAKCPQCMRTNPEGCMPNVFVRNIDMSLIDFQKYVPVKLLTQLQQISFNCPMGDPVAHNNIFPILDYIVQHNPNIKIDFPTNGSLRNAQYWQRLATYTQITATFAIDGVDNQTHQYYRRNTNLDKILEKYQIRIDKFLDGTDHDDFAAPDLSQLRIKNNQNSSIDGLHVEDVKNLMKNMNFIHTP